MGRIAITVGDLLGIGEEIVIKALMQLRLPREKVVIIGKKIDAPYDFIEVDGADNGKFCYDCLSLACQMAKKGEITALVTAPVSKEALYKSGYKFSGQTEILGELLEGEPEMLFIAQKAQSNLRVMLLTRHLPLSQVPSVINKKMIIEKTLHLHAFLREKLKIENPHIAFCALNPHAGEGGILGREEIEIINPTLGKLRASGINITDALSADGLFAKIGKKYLAGEKQDYDAVISTFHDQALTAVKALAFDEVVNTTIGLGIIRTSPSSGTAYDIAGKGIADPKSMIEAIKLATTLNG